MQGLVGFFGEIAVDGDQIAGPRNFAGDDDLVFAQAAFERQLGGLQRGEHHALVDDFFGSLAEVFVGVLLHFPHDQLLIERAAVDADANGLAVVARDLADGGELLVAPLAVAHVAGIDAVFIERAGAIGILRQQDVAVVVKIADDRSVAAGIEKTFLDFGECRGGFRHVYCDADKFRSGLRKLEALLRGGGYVRGVRIGHGLDDHWRAAADLNLADLYANRFVPFALHRGSIVANRRGQVLVE